MIGAVYLISAGSGRNYTEEDLELAEVLGYPVAQVVARARSYEAQHGIARVLQTNLLPRSLPEIPGVAVAGRYLAGMVGAEVGGDFYDVLRTPAGAVGIMVGDVAGHDPAAAAAMGQVRSASRALTGQVRTPAELIDLMRSSWDMIGIERMATVLYGRLDLTDGELLLASAGHPSPIRVSDGKAQVIALEPAPPLGLPDGTVPIPEVSEEELKAFATGERQLPAIAAPAVGWKGSLAPGEVLLLYTDGLVERRDRPVQAGIAALAELAATTWEGDVNVFCDAVLSQMTDGLVLFDDIALLAVTVVGND